MAEQDEGICIRFGRRVRTLRSAKGVSQERLGLECGLSQTYISEVEAGKRNISLENIYGIARAFDITLTELMEGVG